MDDALRAKTGLTLTRNDSEHSAIRHISTIEVSTPLLVPSFSSVGFPHINDVYQVVKHQLYGVCLVSASDIAAGLIPPDISEDINVVIVDSGTYEANQASDGGTSPNSYPTCTWARDSYLRIASRCDPTANHILVNYDTPGPLVDQINRALEDFSHATQAAKDLLVKPEPPDRLINVARLIENTHKLGQFDLIGLTAREAGISLVQRCRAIVTLRKALTAAELGTPIHVFGAITPAEVMTYFFCGADVFDGLNWLRLSFRQETPVPIEQLSFNVHNRGLADHEIHTAEWASNLNLLYRLQEALHHYASRRDLERLSQEFPLALQARRIAKIAGAEV